MVLLDVFELLVDAFERLGRLAAVAHEDDALNDVGFVVVADDVRGVARRRSRRCATSFTRTGTPVLLGDDDVLDVVDVVE